MFGVFEMLFVSFFKKKGHLGRCWEPVQPNSHGHVYVCHDVALVRKSTLESPTKTTLILSCGPREFEDPVAVAGMYRLC